MSAKNVTRILVVDDHQLFIDGIHHILYTLDDQIEIIECNTAEDAVQQIGINQGIDLILLDLHLPGMDGMAILKRINSECKSLPVVIISAEEDIYEIHSIMNAGAMGFIPKSSTSTELQNALLAVMSGEIYIPEKMRNAIKQMPARRATKPDCERHAYGTSLTKRQQEILELLGRGYTNKQISTALFISENTVKVHLSAVYHVLGVKSRTQCLKTARQNGLIN